MMSWVKREKMDILFDYKDEWVSANEFYQNLVEFMESYNALQETLSTNKASGWFKRNKSEVYVKLYTNPLTFAKDVKIGKVVVTNEDLKEDIIYDYHSFENIRVVHNVIRTACVGSGSCMCELNELLAVDRVIKNKECYLK